MLKLQTANKRVWKAQGIEYMNAKKKGKSLVAQKSEANEAFGKKIDEGTIGNQKLFWKGVKNLENQGMNNCTNIRTGMRG